MKNHFLISDSEKSRILNLHESRKPHHGTSLLNEEVKKVGDKYELKDGKRKGFSFEITNKFSPRREVVDSSKGYFKKMGMNSRNVNTYRIKIIDGTKSLCGDGLCEGDEGYLETYRGSHGKYEWSVKVSNDKIGSFIELEDNYKKI